MKLTFVTFILFNLFFVAFPSGYVCPAEIEENIDSVLRLIEKWKAKFPNYHASITVSQDGTDQTYEMFRFLENGKVQFRLTGTAARGKSSSTFIFFKGDSGNLLVYFLKLGILVRLKDSQQIKEIKNAIGLEEDDIRSMLGISLISSARRNEDGGFKLFLDIDTKRLINNMQIQGITDTTKLTVTLFIAEDGKISRIIQTFNDLTVVSEINYRSLDFGNVKRNAPAVPPESDIDDKKTFSEVLRQELLLP